MLIHIWCEKHSSWQHLWWTVEEDAEVWSVWQVRSWDWTQMLSFMLLELTHFSGGFSQGLCCRSSSLGPGHFWARGRIGLTHQLCWDRQAWWSVFCHWWLRDIWFYRCWRLFLLFYREVVRIFSLSFVSIASEARKSSILLQDFPWYRSWNEIYRKCHCQSEGYFYFFICRAQWIYRWLRVQLIQSRGYFEGWPGEILFFCRKLKECRIRILLLIWVDFCRIIFLSVRRVGSRIFWLGLRGGMSGRSSICTKGTIFQDQVGCLLLQDFSKGIWR